MRQEKTARKNPNTHTKLTEKCPYYGEIKNEREKRGKKQIMG